MTGVSDETAEVESWFYNKIFTNLPKVKCDEIFPDWSN